MTFIRRTAAATCAILALIAAPSLGRTQPIDAADADAGASVNVSLDIADCVQTDAASVRRLFLLELGTSRRETPTSATGAKVEIDCSGDLLELRVHDRLTGKHLLRRIAPGPAAGRDRMLALAVMELLVASWIELETTPVPSVRAADSAPNPDGATSARALVRRRFPAPIAQRSTLSVFGGGEKSGPWRVGGGARLLRTASRRHGWSAELSVNIGDLVVPEGEVELTAASAAGALLVGRLRGDVRAYGGGGMRAGLVSIQGRSQRPDVQASSVTGFTGGPFARGGIDVTVRGSVTVGATVDLRVDAIGVRGLVDGRDDLDVGRVWLSTDVGVGWTF